MKFIFQSLLILAGITALYLVYFAVERGFGQDGKNAFAMIAGVAAAAFLFFRWRKTGKL